MGSRASLLVVAVGLSIMGWATLGSVDLRGTAREVVSSSSKERSLYNTAAWLITPTLEPRAYLPIIMHNFCGTMSPPGGAKLFGVVFLDYNGNGVRDDGEPGIPKATVRVGNLSIASGSDGMYALERVPLGSGHLYVEKDGFRYLIVSDHEHALISEGIEVVITHCTRFDIALTEGLLTNVFPCETYWEPGAPFDHIYPGIGGLDYQGRTDTIRPNPLQPGTYDWDNHEGNDFVADHGVPVVAPSDATVMFYRDIESIPMVRLDLGSVVELLPGYNVRLHVMLSHLKIDYDHLNEVGVGGRIPRGFRLGWNDRIGTGGDHVHLKLGYNGSNTPYGDFFIPVDVYGPVDGVVYPDGSDSRVPPFASHILTLSHFTQRNVVHCSEER